jgi:hypothetical protein
MMRAIEGNATPADRLRSPFVYLPFEVLPGTTRIEVRYSYDAGNILDIGIFDPTLGAFPSQTGFRGWSGGARASFFVATDDATPGYIPGEIAPGRWQIILGLAHVSPPGCHYRVEIATDQTVRPVVAPARSVPTARSGQGWYKGDLQSHTHHSDAKGSLDDLATAAKARGLDFLAVTDHNTYSHHRQLAEVSSAKLLLIPGVEVTTYRGHANVWGVPGWVDFRILDEEQLPVLIAHVHRRGGLFSVNHPKVTPNCIGCDWEYPVPEGIDCMEVWQGPWLNRNRDSLGRYDALLRQGRKVTLVGGSDRHQPGWPDLSPDLLQVGSPTTWLYLDELSVPAVLAALRAGRAFVSESPQGPRLELFLDDAPMGSTVQRRKGLRVRAAVRGAAGDILRWVGATGVLREQPIDDSDFEDVWDLTTDGAYLRAEVVAKSPDEKTRDLIRQLQATGKLPGGLEMARLERQELIRALSNPVYVDSGG